MKLNKIQAGFVAGAVVILVGLLLAFGADGLATHWESVGSNAWGGTTDPNLRNLYQSLGWAIAGFGFFMTGSTFHYWLSRPRAIRR